MLNDLVAGVITLTLLIILCGLAGWRFATRVTARQSGVMAALTVLLMVVILVLLQDSLLLAYLFPYPGVVILGNTVLPMIALLSGTLAGRHRPQGNTRYRQFLIPGLLMILGFVQATRPYWGSPPATHTPYEEDGVILQTSDSSCSAASAATILHHYSIPATEGEMAILCLTRQDGTSMLGVYRGLYQKTRGTPYTVSVLAGGNISDLRRLTAEGPILLSVGLDRFTLQLVDPRYTQNWGWSPGERHAVILFGFLADGTIDVGDPAVGREHWPADALRVLWHGDGIRLKRRE
jgi:hypothetical protein